MSRPLQGRPLDLTHCDEIARLLVDGLPLAEIARRLELPYTTASRRVETMRRVLAKESGEGAWVDKEERTAIQVGRGWLERAAEALLRALVDVSVSDGDLPPRALNGVAVGGVDPMVDAALPRRP